MVDFKKFITLPEPTENEYESFTKKQKDDFNKLMQRKHQCFRGDADEFVQVECGYKHALLLNRKGQVFSFGQGL